MRVRPGLLIAVGVSLVTVGACHSSSKATSTATSGAQPAAAGAAASGTPADQNVLTGTVAETMNSGGYTYVRLQAEGKDVWIAASEFATKPGDRLSARLDMPMENFESKTLKRTFPLIYFVSGVTRDGQRVDGPAGAAGAQPTLMTSHGAAPVSTTVEPVAPPAGGMSIADVWAKRKALAGRELMVRGKVVKVNNQIMGRNWVHLQDGSGAVKDGTNDLTITTDDAAGVGDVVTFKGILAIDKDFTAGYRYGAILENSRLIK